MNISLPNISPQTMKKYPLYVLIAFLSTLTGYFLNSNTNSQKEALVLARIEIANLNRKKDSTERELSNFKDALLIQNGIIKNLKEVVTNTDSIAKRNITKPANEIFKLNK